MKDFLLLDEMLDKQKIHLNKAYEEGYKEGYKDGYDKGYAEVKTVIDKIRAEIETRRDTIASIDSTIPKEDLTIKGIKLAYNDVLNIINKQIGDTE